MAITFEPSTQRIILDSTYVNVQDIYSRWKEWVEIGDNAKYFPAFSVVGGDSLGGGLYVASYFFLMNGWRIRPMEANQSLQLVGNISVLGGGVPVVPTLGNYNVSVQFTVPVQAQGVATDGGGSSGSPAEVAAAVIAALQGTMLDANIRKVNNILVGGVGTEVDPWGPA